MGSGEPDVRRPLGRRHRWVVFLGYAVTFALGWFLGMAMLSDAPDQDDNFTVVGASLAEGSSGESVVTGGIRNNTDRSYPHVGVEVDLIGEDGNVIGRGSSVTSELAPGETWMFSIPAGRDPPARFDIKVIAPVPYESEP